MNNYGKHCSHIQHLYKHIINQQPVRLFYDQTVDLIQIINDENKCHSTPMAIILTVFGYQRPVSDVINSSGNDMLGLQSTRPLISPA